MNTEFSPEAKREIVDGILQDINRLQQFFQMHQGRNINEGMYAEIPYRDLESLVYITEQLRLKLKLLGAPRIN